MSALQFNNTEIAFQAKSNLDLRRAWMLFRSFEYPSLVKFGPKLVEVALKAKLPVRGVIKPTLFSQFCGGESVKDCLPVVKRLGTYSIDSVLDYGVEGREREEDFAATFEELLNSIQQAAKQEHLPFLVFKMTGIARFSLLERISSQQNLEHDEELEWQTTKMRVMKLCEQAGKVGRKIMIDAEETWIQPAIDQLVYEAMLAFNKTRAVVYNTVQMYRHDRLQYIESIIRQAENDGIYVGIKVVRGAYMEKERQRAKDHLYASPIWPSKKETDEAFDKALEMIVSHIDRVSLCAGSHNEESCLYLTDLMRQSKIDHHDERIYFSQLYGMSDHLSFNLAAHGYRVVKYIPYGPVDAVLPYLFRRAEENSSIAGQVSRELKLIEIELKRRKETVA